MSQILTYVSRRELERFEQEDYRQIAEAEELVRLLELEETAKRTLLRNAKPRHLVRGDPSASRLMLDNGETSIRTRGRGRGRGRPRGRGRGGLTGRGGLGPMAESTADAEGLDPGLLEQETPESAITDASESDDEDESNLHSSLPSPNVTMSSFVANSALPLSPVAKHRRLSKVLPMHGQRAHEVHYDYGDPEEDTLSMSSAAAQLQFERDMYGKQFLSDDEIAESEQEEVKDEIHDEDRQRVKRPKRGSTASASVSTAALPCSKTQLTATVEHPSDDNAIYQHPFFTHNAPQRKNKATDALDHTRPENDERLNGSDEDTDPSDAEGIADEEEYVVEAILAHSYENGVRYFLVKWAGYEDTTDWLPEDDLAGAQEMVDEYNAKVKKNKGKRTRA